MSAVYGVNFSVWMEAFPTCTEGEHECHTQGISPNHQAEV